MNIAVTLQLDNMPDETDLEVVEDVIRRQAAEWLDLDRHSQDLHVTASEKSHAHLLCE